MHYPVMLDLRGRLAVVIGGDAQAAARVEGLLAAGARVRVVAAEVVPELKALDIEWCDGPPDLAGAWIVFALQADLAVIEEAQRRGLLLNVMDRPEYCSFAMPSVLRRGHLTVAVSSNGTSPGMARRVRQRIEEWLGPAWTELMELAASARQRLKDRGASCRERDAFCDWLCESDVLPHLSRGERTAARALVQERLA